MKRHSGFTYFCTMVAAFVAFLISPDTAAEKSSFSETLCQDPQFICTTIQKGDTWQTLWPDEIERDAIKRLNRINVRLRPGMSVAVPDKNREMKWENYVPFPLQREDVTEKTLIFDPTRLAWGAYDANGALLRWGPASGGGDWCADIGNSCHTLTGEFYALYKRGAQCRSGKYPLPNGGARMPYCVFFARGYAFHGSPEVPGYNASHGCVRLFDEDARWINEEFIELPAKESGISGTRVIILAY